MSEATHQPEPDRCDYVVRLRPITTGWRIAPTQRLRLALKVLLRAFGLRAVALRCVAAPERSRKLIYGRP